MKGWQSNIFPIEMSGFSTKDYLFPCAVFQGSKDLKIILRPLYMTFHKRNSHEEITLIWGQNTSIWSEAFAAMASDSFEAWSLGF
jgi:hypothetical protein